MLNRVLKDSEGIDVIYSRRIGNNVYATALTVQPAGGQGTGETESVSIGWSERDFLIEADDLLLNNLGTTPQRGDRITIPSVDTGEDQVWELAAQQSDIPCWSYSDPQTRTLFRVRCKRAT